MNKEYCIEKSPLYKLRNKQKLAILLGLPNNYFRKVHQYKYSEFYEYKPNGGKRRINNPEEELKKIQKKLFKLLNRIEKPIWVISGVKGKSYVDNAKLHQLSDNICTIDIEQFYDSTKEIYVYNFFKNIMKMSKDVSAVLTKIVTYEGRIPTGTPTSQLIAFLSYKDIFTKIYEKCKSEEILFSLYVDDITLSSNKIIPKKIKNEINYLLNLKKLNIKKSKTRFYSKKSNKSVTGIIIDHKKQIKLENKKRKEIIDLYKECINRETFSIEKLVKLNGKINDATQVEKNIFPTISAYLKKHQKEIKKYNNEQANKKRIIKQMIKRKNLNNKNVH